MKAKKDLLESKPQNMSHRSVKKVGAINMNNIGEPNLHAPHMK